MIITEESEDPSVSFKWVVPIEWIIRTEPNRFRNDHIALPIVQIEDTCLMERGKFTIQLAVLDAVPVLLFSITTAVLSGKINQPIFTVGAILCICAGLGKVIWKLVLALGGPDIPILGAQLRYVMPAGFLLMIIGAIRSNTTGVLIQNAVKMPSVLFFIIGCVGMLLMVFCAKRFGRKDGRGYWIEESINCCLQASILIGVLLL